MKPFARFVRLFEKERAAPPKRPLEISGSAWHGPATQERMCVNCKAVMIEGTGRLWLGRFCGRCALAGGYLPPAA